MATKKAPGKAIVKWDEELANLAKDATKDMELSTAKFVSIKGGKLTFAGAAVPGNELRCVILAYVLENQYYDQPFDPDTPQVPACYAFGIDKDEMVPHEQAPDKQCDSCAECPLNQYESANGGRGKGKACKNVIRLALIAESDLDDLDNAEVVYLKIPVTSTKNFLAYAKKQIGEVIKRPYWSVITLIKVEPSDNAVTVLFSMAEKIEDSDLFSPLKDLYSTTMEGIDFPYPAAIERAKAKPKVKGKPAKFSKR